MKAAQNTLKKAERQDARFLRDGKSRHVLLTVKRWHPEVDLNTDTAYSLEALEIKETADGNSPDTFAGIQADTGDPAKTLARFRAGIKEEHRAAEAPATHEKGDETTQSPGKPTSADLAAESTSFSLKPFEPSPWGAKHYRNKLAAWERGEDIGREEISLGATHRPCCGLQARKSAP
jgi:hypothetical protein